MAAEVLVAAAVEALRAVPEANSRWHDDRLEIFDDINIGSVGLHTLRTRLSVIPQVPVLFSGCTVRENLDPFATHTDDHVDWRYDTVIVQADPELYPHEMNNESQELRWITWYEIEAMPLHPSFAKSWPAVRAILERDF